MRRTLRLQGRIPKYLPHILPAARPVKLRRVPYFWAAGRGETILKPAPPNSLYALDAVFMGQGHLVPTTTDTGGGGGGWCLASLGSGLSRGGVGSPSPRGSPARPRSGGAGILHPPLPPKPSTVGVWVRGFSIPPFPFLPGKDGPVRTFPHRSPIGPGSRKNAKPGFIYMQIFAADLRASGAVGKKSLFQKPLFK